jgi:plastocyanin
MTTHDESPIIRTSPKRMGQGIAIIVIVLAVCTVILVPNWNQMSKVPPPVSSIAVTPPPVGTTAEVSGPPGTPTNPTTQGPPGTPTTPATQGGGGGGSTTTNAPVVAGVTITIQKGASIQGSPDYNPDTAKVPVSDNIVWVNEDTAAHTATSGTGASDPDSGKVFDTSIINPGEKSTPQALKGVKEGDEVPYYCAVHPYMTSKLTVTAASAGAATSAGNASSGSNTSSAATTTGTSNATSNTSAAAAAATLTIPVGASTPGNPSYQPLSLTVKKGDAIAVVNKDSSPHTVTSGKTPDAPDVGKQFDTSIVNAGQSAKVDTANVQPGEYDFHCAIHPFMMGKIKVQ